MTLGARSDGLDELKKMIAALRAPLAAANLRHEEFMPKPQPNQEKAKRGRKKKSNREGVETKTNVPENSEECKERERAGGRTEKAAQGMQKARRQTQKSAR